jgi:hypothetical protein
LLQNSIYGIAGGDVGIVATLLLHTGQIARINTTLGTVSTSISQILGEQGAIEAALNGFDLELQGLWTSVLTLNGQVATHGESISALGTTVEGV